AGLSLTGGRSQGRSSSSHSDAGRSVKRVWYCPIQRTRSPTAAGSPKQRSTRSPHTPPSLLPRSRSRRSPRSTLATSSSTPRRSARCRAASASEPRSTTITSRYSRQENAACPVSCPGVRSLIRHPRAVVPTSRTNMQHRDYLVIDLEATCDNAGAVPKREMEIIEIGAVLVDRTSFEPIAEFQTFVRPVRHPKLTRFCQELTSITQAQVDA